MRRIGARVLAFLAVALASFALWSGLALAGSAATSGSGTDDAGSVVTRSRLIQTQTPDGEETPDADETPGRRPCPKDREGGGTDESTDTESTETSTAV